MSSARTVLGGRVRVSTVALAGVFLAVLTLWILVRPVPVEIAEEGTTTITTTTTKRVKGGEQAVTENTSPSSTAIPRTTQSARPTAVPKPSVAPAPAPVAPPAATAAPPPSRGVGGLFGQPPAATTPAPAATEPPGTQPLGRP